MVSESDFIAAFQAYHDALEDPAAKIDTIRPLVNDHLEQLIARLPGQVVQNAARERAMSELDRIEEMAKEKVVEVADQISGLGRPESREEFDAFYAELEERDLLDLLGSAGKDYSFGARHQEAFDELQKRKAEEADASSAEDSDSILSVEPESPLALSNFNVHFTDASGEPTAWIGVYPAGAPHGEHGTNWLYVGGSREIGEGKTSGSVTFSEGREAGDYEARLFRNNGHELMASASFIILPETVVEEESEEEPSDSLLNAFNLFDRDGNGVIDIQELHLMMNTLGESMTAEEILELLSEADADGDGVINFEEFKVIMLMDRSGSEAPAEEEEAPDEPEPEPEPSAPSTSGSIADVVTHLDTLKLFGDKRRYIESLSDQVFDFTLHIDKMEKTIGIGLSDAFRGGDTCIGTIDDIGVGVRMPNTMELALGQDVYVEAKLLEYRSVVKRFEFEQL